MMLPLLHHGMVLVGLPYSETSLRETRSAGEVMDFYTERTIKNGFSGAEEWWQVEIRYHTRQFRLAIIFPAQRRCRKKQLQRSHEAAGLRHAG